MKRFKGELEEVSSISGHYLILKCDSLTISNHHLWNESERIDDGLIDRCVEVGVGTIGTSSLVQLIGVAYNLYKQLEVISQMKYFLKERLKRNYVIVFKFKIIFND
ncbi:unnamed protein product [Brugia timori]|uniref:Transposase n=1 Tax=Brugia timori TaxID=42155 RepID=A0A0R3QE40_9BILA|nr:unnamed protein product [Brugia timori]